MAKYHIVTDSGARFSNPRLLQQYPVTVLPYKLDFGGNLYREGIDMDYDEIMRLIKSQSKPPKLDAPTVEEYAKLYAKLSRAYDAIISIHTSRELTQSWDNARHAAQQVKDSVEIVVVDSRSICAGQGMLVRVGGQAALEQLSFEEAVNKVRNAVDRLYSTYFVESLDFLQQNTILSESRAILGTMLNIKPIVSMEEGIPIVTEKVRTRSQAIDRLVEFLVEFDSLDDAMIVQNRVHITEQARTLQDRLSSEFPGRHFPYTMYGAALGVLLGGDATGIVVLESEIEGFDNG
ncbi:MAG: DegV family protein [Anaerolineae bacterium]|nr:DegV family protein [Anaerolineae bacterium]